MTFKEKLLELVKKCEKLGDSKVSDAMDEAYSGGAQGSEIIGNTINQLNNQ